MILPNLWGTPLTQRIHYSFSGDIFSVSGVGNVYSAQLSAGAFVPHAVTPPPLEKRAVNPTVSRVFFCCCLHLHYTAPEAPLLLVRSSEDAGFGKIILFRMSDTECVHGFSLSPSHPTAPMLHPKGYQMSRSPSNPSVAAARAPARPVSAIHKSERILHPLVSI